MRSPEDRADLKILKTIIRSVMAAHLDDDIIKPYELATIVMKEITPEIRYLAGHFAVRQLFRGRLRRTYDVDPETRTLRRREPPLPHLPLVHERYPTEDGSGYVKREKMQMADCLWNINRRLIGPGSKMVAHGEQLKIWAKDWYKDWPKDDSAGVEA